MTCVYILYTQRSPVTYLWLPQAVEHLIKVSLRKAASVQRRALESEETIICTTRFLEFELDEGYVSLRCEFVSHLSSISVFFSFCGDNHFFET